MTQWGTGDDKAIQGVVFNHGVGSYHFGSQCPVCLQKQHQPCWYLLWGETGQSSRECILHPAP